MSKKSIENGISGISLESYLVGFTQRALEEIAECLAENDTNKAIRKTYESIEFLKQNIRFNSKDEEQNKFCEEKSKED